MKIDQDLIRKFEEQLDPQNIEASGIPAKLVGFGEISSIIALQDLPGMVLKRMPMFPDVASAENYLNTYREYCSLLNAAGLKLPADDTAIIKKSERLTVLYFAQQKFLPEQIGNKVLKSLEKAELEQFIERVIAAIYSVWRFNKSQDKYQLAIDAQISNWAYVVDKNELYYIDTSTPLFKIDGIEQLDPELILTSAPSFGRAIIRKFFLADVMNRYYDEKSVNVDLVANLYKEKLANLVPLFIEKINERSSGKLTEEEVAAYYKEDNFIWALFLSLRKIDRWLHTYLYRKQYQFILPGKIER
ncbi:MAG: hypothetical protein CMN32_11015 [Saprospirales bacterium]|nr:hypothetical protein [Saprospirales bacterium]